MTKQTEDLNVFRDHAGRHGKFAGYIPTSFVEEASRIVESDSGLQAVIHEDHTSGWAWVKVWKSSSKERKNHGDQMRVL